jgi:hypothetical protein
MAVQLRNTPVIDMPSLREIAHSKMALMTASVNLDGGNCQNGHWGSELYTVGGVWQMTVCQDCLQEASYSLDSEIRSFHPAEKRQYLRLVR